MKRLGMFILAAVLLVSCTKETNFTVIEKDGKSIYQNKNQPANTNLKLEVQELFTIGNDTTKTDGSGLSIPFAVEVDNDGFIYVLDYADKKVKKYNAVGEFILSFGNNGNGPGEYLAPSGVFISGNKVYVNDVRQRSLVVFDTDGKFIENITMDKNFISVAPISGNRYLCGIIMPEQVEGEFKLIKNFGIYDKEFNLTNKLHETSYSMGKDLEFNPLNYFYSSAIHKDKIYLAKNSDSDYSVEIYDLDGRNIEGISKSYMKHKVSEEDFEREKNFLNSLSGSKFEENFLTYKNSIGGAFNYNDEYLLISTPKKTGEPLGIKFDVFKNNIFQNSVYLNIRTESEMQPQFKIVKNKLYSIDRKSDDCLVVYGLKITE